jgi:hypothetical protein
MNFFIGCYRAVFPNPWFANRMGLAKSSMGSRKKGRNGGFLWTHFNNATSNVVSLATVHLSEKFTSVHCSLTRKTKVSFYTYLVFCKKPMEHNMTRRMPGQYIKIRPRPLPNKSFPIYYH